MNTALECVPCLVRQAVEALGLSVADEARREQALREIVARLASEPWNVAPVLLAQQMHNDIRVYAGDPDPYRSIKDRMNRLALELLPALRKDAERHGYPQEAAVRIAIAGNLLDSGAKTSMSDDDVRAAMRRVFQDELLGSTASLFDAAAAARQILYLTDNAGEIVFDRILLETLPAEKIFVGVRGALVINDATQADAEVAGLPGIAPVISNGSNAPGTLVDRCSAEFRRVFESSDLIIAKGQGNYESLQTAPKHIFFLLRVKCARIAARVSAPVGAMVVCERKGTDSNAAGGVIHYE